ncbi:MAG: translation initiation factor IF-3 [Acidobacteriota bacterium]
MNHQIRLSPIRLIGPDGTQLGVVSIDEAQRIARESNLDLVEVDPNARPIVCKIIDWGRAKYDLAKKEKSAKRHEKTLAIKQVKFRPGIDGHDFETKLNHARRFLMDGKRTKVTIMFRRRDLRRPENGSKILDRVAESLADVGKVESRPRKIENRDMTMVMVPLAGIGHSSGGKTARKPEKAAAPVSPPASPPAEPAEVAPAKTPVASTTR